MNLFQLLEKAAAGRAVSVRWFFDPDDDMMEELERISPRTLSMRASRLSPECWRQRIEQAKQPASSNRETGSDLFTEDRLLAEAEQMTVQLAEMSKGFSSSRLHRRAIKDETHACRSTQSELRYQGCWKAR